jgi:hypothetical protein
MPKKKPPAALPDLADVEVKLREAFQDLNESMTRVFAPGILLRYAMQHATTPDGGDLDAVEAMRALAAKLDTVRLSEIMIAADLISKVVQDEAARRIADSMPEPEQAG